MDRQTLKPDPPANLLPVERASRLCPDSDPVASWLIDELWSEQAVGILGGEPKCCKSFLALDIAVSVAAGVDCLRHFAVRRPGPVLLFPAEDSLAAVRHRLEAIATAAGTRLDGLPIDVITQPVVRLDLAIDRQRLADTVGALRPRLLILDPLIRLHRVDENDAGQIAALLSFLRELQRDHQLAVLVVHHARKDAASARPGQALRGSSELHGWGDSNLYMRRRAETLTLSTEHRAAPSRNHIPLELTPSDSSASLALVRPIENTQSQPTLNAPAAAQRVTSALAQLDEPIAFKDLRQRCQMRTSTLCSTLKDLCADGLVHCDPSGGYQLRDTTPTPTFPVSLPIDPLGKGNGKHHPNGS